MCYILEDLIKISLFRQLKDYRKSMIDAILPLRSWPSIPSLFLDQDMMKRKQPINVMINTIFVAGDKDIAVTDHVTS